MPIWMTMMRTCFLRQTSCPTPKAMNQTYKLLWTQKKRLSSSTLPYHAFLRISTNSSPSWPKSGPIIVREISTLCRQQLPSIQLLTLRAHLKRLCTRSSQNPAAKSLECSTKYAVELRTKTWIAHRSLMIHLITKLTTPLRIRS